MPRVSEPYIDKALEALAERVDEWCAVRPSEHEPIPQPLLKEAVEISRRLPLSRVAKRLGLRASELKRHRACGLGPPKAGRTRARTTDSVSFVEAVGTKVEVGCATELEVQRPDGNRLYIRNLSDASVTAILRTFVAG